MGPARETGRCPCMDSQGAERLRELIRKLKDALETEHDTRDCEPECGMCALLWPAK